MLRATAPSVLFSTGTTANSASALRWQRNTSSMVAHGNSSALPPKNRSAACSLKVPAGPR
jgi:hypothetical protein